MGATSMIPERETERDRAYFYQAIAHAKSVEERNNIIRDYAERFGLRKVEHGSMEFLPLIALRTGRERRR